MTIPTAFCRSSEFQNNPALSKKTTKNIFSPAIAIPAIIPYGEGTLSDAIALNLGLPQIATDIIGIAGIALIVAAILKFSIFKKNKKEVR